MQFLEENNLESIVSPCCAICCQEFKAGDEVKQIIIGKVEPYEDLSLESGIETEMRLAIKNAKVADIHVSCE